MHMKVYAISGNIMCGFSGCLHKYIEFNGGKTISALNFLPQGAVFTVLSILISSKKIIQSSSNVCTQS